MFLKCDPYRVWCSIFYSKLVNCILLRSLFVFVKGRGTCGNGERNVKIWINFRKSPRFSPLSPLSQEREKSSRPVFTMCGEPWMQVVLMYHLKKLLIKWKTEKYNTVRTIPNSNKTRESWSGDHKYPRIPNFEWGNERNETCCDLSYNLFISWPSKIYKFL
jgi:hypothetical protein